MMNRDEYVAKLKGQLDRWNAEAAKWTRSPSCAACRTPRPRRGAR